MPFAENIKNFAVLLQTQEAQYFILFPLLLILPKVLLRYRVPTALTAIFLGFVAHNFLDWFEGDQLLLMLSRLGITSLFLFAGMEVDIDELKEDSSTLAKHTIKFVGIVFISSFVFHHYLVSDYRAALLLSLGLMTPSTGFILNSIKSIRLTDEQYKWVKSKAISKELVAISLLFFTMQSKSMSAFFISSLSMVAMVLVLPLLFKFFLTKIAPYAPDSEVTFLILIALLCGIITTKLGAYYLVGAFVVGMTAGRFKHFMGTEKAQNMLYSVSLFFSFFVPFYFFKAGFIFETSDFTLQGLLLGGVLLLVFLPLRYYTVLSSLWFFNIESWKDRFYISMPLLPTLIFGLVILTLLKERYDVPNTILAGLMIYTIIASILPWFFLSNLPPEEYDASMK